MTTDGHWPLALESPALGGITVIGCECGELPRRRASRASMQHVWHQSHRRRLNLQPVEYAWEDCPMHGLSEGGLVQVRGHEWSGGTWVPCRK